MKFKSIIKSLILEARIPIGEYEVDDHNVTILYNTHSDLATSDSEYGRMPVDEIKTAMEDILEVIVEVSLKVLKKEQKWHGDKSILIVDNQIGGDYHFWVNKSKSDDIYLTINTSINHPRHLPTSKNSAKIIVTRTGDTIVKESIDNTFTSKIIGDIIVYYKLY